ncbi:protein-disulfide reductase DsbD domain-containing protein [Devosia rhizoryzae]|uniref:Thiol:disulfide interchange protein DsbD N-terminal domain-containing protein n=1 Tax=Devosia rhizoryzae TaxID=2774137 RepID=A0ABX7C4I9_9HYPH|nr:protein-disulfide reductase DsbD domain-containing protein [Devosia rhizoryzae]QQR38154.1 hypothetical protein JI748_10155 [Devosia rhizoryzae]
MRLPVLAIAVLALVAPAGAAETPWQEVAPGVAMRLISTGEINEGGETLVALELDMPEDTKTYWRVPGETGLPLDLDFTASTGIGSHRVLWPYPLREDKNGYLDYVYYGHTVLPLAIDVTDPAARLNIAVTLGVCSDICIPAQAQFALSILDKKPDRPSALRIRQALAEVPLAWDGSGEPVGDVEMVGEQLAVEVAPDLLDSQSLIAATDNGETLFGAPQKSPQADLVLLPILGKTDNSALDGMDVELTFMTDRGAYMVSRSIEAGDGVDTVRIDDEGEPGR